MTGKGLKPPEPAGFSKVPYGHFEAYAMRTTNQQRQPIQYPYLLFCPSTGTTPYFIFCPSTETNTVDFRYYFLTSYLEGIR